MKLSIRRKVFWLTAALSLALIAAAVFISYALFSARVRRDVAEGTLAAAKGMADELTDYHMDFLTKLQKSIDDIYQENRAEIEHWSYQSEETFEDYANYFNKLTSNLLGTGSGLGLSYEKSLFLRDYKELRVLFNVTVSGTALKDAAVFYYDAENNNMVYLLDSASSESPLYRFPASAEKPTEEMLRYVIHVREPDAYYLDDYYCIGAVPVYGRDQNTPLAYVYFRDTLVEADSHQKSFMLTIALVMLAVTSLLALVYLVFVDRFIARNITRLSDSAQRFTEKLEQGEEPEPVVTKIKTGDELGVLSQKMDLMQKQMVEYILKLGEKTAQEESIKAELSLASRIQTESLPESGFAAADFTIDSLIRPAREVGGDLYDYYRVDDKHLFFVVADVSGKGVPAALFMMRGKELIRAHATAGKTPKQIAAAVNDELCRGNEEGLFITAFFGIVNLSSHLLRYTRAGHEQPFLLREGKALQISEESNMVLGLFESFEYTEDSLSLEPGDRLVVFTDGLNEGISPAGEAFGYERIQQVLESTPDNTLPALYESLNRFSDGAEQFDDVTLLQLSLKDPRHWTFKNPSYSDITTVCDGIAEALKDIHPEASAHLSIAADEIINNCISYGFDGIKEPFLSVRLRLTKQQAELTFEDNGNPYDPFSTPREMPREDILERPEGGLGIHFVKEFCDETLYEYAAGKNRLILRKNLFNPGEGNAI